MKPHHLLIIFLVLVALGSQAYVQLEYEYRDAPHNVRLAYLIGVGVLAILALLLGPRMLGGKGKGPVFVPV